MNNNKRNRLGCTNKCINVVHVIFKIVMLMLMLICFLTTYFWTSNNSSDVSGPFNTSANSQVIILHNAGNTVLFFVCLCLNKIYPGWMCSKLAGRSVNTLASMSNSTFEADSRMSLSKQAGLGYII